MDRCYGKRCCEQVWLLCTGAPLQHQQTPLTPPSATSSRPQKVLLASHRAKLRFRNSRWTVQSGCCDQMIGNEVCEDFTPVSLLPSMHVLRGSHSKSKWKESSSSSCLCIAVRLLCQPALKGTSLVVLWLSSRSSGNA